MTEQKHTPEPWATDAKRGFDNDVHCANGMLIARCAYDDDARRIVACVNACAGMPTWKLERDGLPSVREYLDMEAQRDQLRAALESLLVLGDNGVESWRPEWDEARAALAATE